MNRKAQVAEQILLLIVLIFFLFGFMWFYFGVGCHIKAKLDFNKDTICRTSPNPGLITLFDEHKVVNLAEEEKARVAAEEQRRIDEINRIEREAQEKICYDNGYHVNRTLDIYKDYKLNCEQLAYINDHLIDRVDQKDGGYIDGSSFGIYGGMGFGFSRGSVEGKFYEYVVTRVSATGKLVKSVEYHVNCRNETSGEKIQFYDEAQFVMYYVDSCIENKDRRKK